MAEMQRAVTEIDNEMIQPVGRRRAAGTGQKGIRKAAGREVQGVWMSAGEREEARGEEWGGQVKAARRALTVAMRGGRAEEGDWEAVRQLLGGLLKRPAAAEGWDGWEARSRVRNVAEAIGRLQDVAWRNITEWRDRTVKERG